MIQTKSDLKSLSFPDQPLHSFVEAEFSRSFFYEILLDLSSLCPHLQRIESKPIKGGILVIFKKIAEALPIFEEPQRSRGVLFYANEPYKAQLAAALGSYRLRNPSHQIYFLQDLQDTKFLKSLERLQVQVLDPDVIEKALGFDPNKISFQRPLHKAVSRKVLGRYLLFTPYCSCDQLLVSDADVLFLDSVDEAFDQCRDSDLGASVDWMRTDPLVGPIYKEGLENKHRASVGGFFQGHKILTLQRTILDHFGIECTQEELNQRPYFNSGLLFLNKSLALKSVLEKTLDFIHSKTELYYEFWPWPEQTLLNIGAFPLQIEWLNPTVWNFEGPKNKIRHLVGSRAKDLDGYREYQKETEEAWSLTRSNFWSDHSLEGPSGAIKRSDPLTLGWLGEFGWEVTHMVPMANHYAQQGPTTLYTFKETLPLYKDIPNLKVLDHGLLARRSSGFDGEFPEALLGSRNIIFKDNQHLDSRSQRGPIYRRNKKIREDIVQEPCRRVCLHARYISGGESGRNWDLSYNALIPLLQSWGYEVLFIGSKTNSLSFGEDRRGIPLEELIAILKSSTCVLGPISGPLHLAQMCGTSIFTWACKDDRCFVDSARGRIWNPLKTPHYHPWWADEGSPDFCRYFDMDYHPTIKELVLGLEPLLSLSNGS